MIASLSVVPTGFSKAGKVSKFSKKAETNLDSDQSKYKTGSAIFRFTVGFIELSANTFINS